MPTGYTHPVGNGEITDFRTFAMRCARVMGACITMRDDPSDAEIPEKFEPSYDDLKALREAKAQLKELAAMTPAQITERCHQEFEERAKRNQEYYQSKITEDNRYKTMLEKVRAWKPPSEDHNGLKEFMEEQLSGSIIEPREPPVEVEPEPEKWLRCKLNKVTDDSIYHENEHRKEIESTEKRNEWLRLLRESLS